MRLTDLRPRWRQDESGRKVLAFLCPCCRATTIRIPIGPGGWTASGDDFETLTVQPSIDTSGKGHWHGHVTNGRID